MLNGTALEPAARAAYEVQTGNVMQPLVMQDGLYSASLDGITLQGDLIVEIKCPYRGRDSTLWREVESGAVPGHYVAQIQAQLMVSGASHAHLWVFDGEQGLLRTLERDEAAMAAIREAWDVFQTLPGYRHAAAAGRCRHRGQRRRSMGCSGSGLRAGQAGGPGSRCGAGERQGGSGGPGGAPS